MQGKSQCAFTSYLLMSNLKYVTTEYSTMQTDFYIFGCIILLLAWHTPPDKSLKC